jgi:hypothetical protein
MYTPCTPSVNHYYSRLAMGDSALPYGMQGYEQITTTGVGACIVRNFTLDVFGATKFWLLRPNYDKCRKYIHISVHSVLNDFYAHMFITMQGFLYYALIVLFLLFDHCLYYLFVRLRCFAKTTTKS